MRLSRTLASVALAGAIGLAGCDATGPDTAQATADAGNTESYIVVFKDGAPNARGLANRLANGNATHVYENSIRGFAGRFSPQAAAALERNPNVAYVERDQAVSLKRPGSGGGGGGAQSTPYGITRVGGAASGAGLTACVIDSGVDLDHPDLNVDTGRSRTFITSGKDARSADDGNGHGTHVAGTIGAIDNTTGVIGVAAGATIVGVKVLDSRGSGSYSAVIAGVDYVASGQAGCSVANMSLGGPVSAALDNAVLAAGAAGITMVLAAGNESDDANNHSPARAGGVSANDNVFSISAIDSSDNFAYFSNYGSAVAFAAPGVAIESTWKGGGYNTISGTSMASPHAAGVMLLGTARTSGTANGDPDGNPDPIISR
ncbi:S8 family serine peptidase [Rubrivirga sp. IMCC45206]|uniref:S8 family serine peptidase n=1 Tax=Rubrivirga sp. IMCC45206 TaxID=3391614 RepID=UPI0039900DA7